MKKIKKNDQVIVLAGKEKGKKGKVLNVDWKRNRVVVEGINMIVKATRPTQASPAGGFVQKESGIHISNVAIVSPKSGKQVRVKIQRQGNKVVRIGTQCGSVI